MKKQLFLPISPPRFICYNHITYSNAIIPANSSKNSRSFSSKYINCYYKESSTAHKFVISVFDHWCTSQKLMESQSINLLKEVYENQNINLITVIKKFLCCNCYVVGYCNRTYLDLNDNEKEKLFNYVIIGFDDHTCDFTLYGLDSRNDFRCIKINYQSFVNALFDTQRNNIAFTLWRYNSNIVDTFDFANIIFELEDYIDSKNSRNHYTEDKVYGLNAIEMLGKHFAETIEKKEPINEFYLIKLMEHKKYMKDRVLILSQNNVIDRKWVSYANEALIAVQQISEYLNSFNNSRNIDCQKNLHSLFGRCIEIEKFYLAEVLKELKAIN